MSMKNPMTLAGIEPATFRFVAQHLNHCATPVPDGSVIGTNMTYSHKFHRNAFGNNAYSAGCHTIHSAVQGVT